MILTPPVAVSAVGRITPGDAGIYQDNHSEAWQQLVDHIHHRGTRIGIRLGQAGRRGATRSRNEGLDRPLADGGWPLLAPSPLPYSNRNARPREMSRSDMHMVTAEFVQASERAAEADFDLLQLHVADGYLLASFLSPLSNQRTDEYGGSLENRMRFPVEVIDGVRAAWPDDRPLSVALTATDWTREGLNAKDAIAIAKVLGEHGCDLIEVRAGYTIPRMRPSFGQAFLAPYADRIRNEAGIATMVGGAITTTGRANTVLASGRADLCVMDRWA